VIGSVRLSFPRPLVRAGYIDRPNRFIVQARLDDDHEELVHLPDPGRLREVLTPGARLWLLPAAETAQRKTRYDVLLAETEAGLISLDTRLPTQLVRRALEQRAIPEFAAYDTVRPEMPFGHSRIDFLLSGRAGQMLLEVKSVTLVENGVGLFPDAVTARGARHLRELAAALAQGYQAAVLFIVQRADAAAVAPHPSNDPAFAAALRQAAEAGVQLAAYTCRLTPDDITLAGAVPVRPGS
jgi:sugar fermentation stimulation protein A